MLYRQFLAQNVETFVTESISATQVIISETIFHVHRYNNCQGLRVFNWHIKTLNLTY